ncbi:3-methylcrotonyl-CoA carboxylase alpha subunit [Thermonema lapsum]|uniref:3-methylcrotonyl-CoA carboxylase alpha subunit n=1 Tax=Thermonema lapsum TaxID=28195 RepID=A0A846MTZ2_9BACT|nr:biotin carboxylase N-terminal domain-containing protein [Thermonema lapsum]NIK74770.1 3-methylcrotonyl-CoA carboxylase alpha subunit [Thermonema lapsum]
MIHDIRKILIANRGEIARRIQRSCRKMGIATVAVYSDADRYMPFVAEADEAYALGGNTPSESYLNIEKIVNIALKAGVDAIHPGYGFLSENADFARTVARLSQQRVEAGGAPLLFIGPNADAIEQMGSKAKAKALMEAQGVPTVPGFRKVGASCEEMKQAAASIGYPVLLKAVAGGGGKGMRIVRSPEDFEAAFAAAKREALHAFGDDELLLERYFEAARHIEFQILGDRHGHIVHLFERECSIQRRYQKIIEESPSPVLSEEERQAMGAAALRAAHALNYDNAGTVEFIYVGKGEFYFLEVNTRLQVEHPVTEAITGLDLVEWQIRIAAGEPFPYRQEELRQQGYAIEARLCAEDPAQDFRPSTGTIHYWQVPQLPYLRIDSGIESGCDISPYYDSMIAKVIVHAADRRQALQRLHYALEQILCLGIRHNLAFLKALCLDPDFVRGEYDTHFLERKQTLTKAGETPPLALLRTWAVGLTLHRVSFAVQGRGLLPSLVPNWRNVPQATLPYGWKLGNQIITVECSPLAEGLFCCKGEGWEGHARLLQLLPREIVFEWEGQRFALTIIETDAVEHRYVVWQAMQGSIEAFLLPRFPELKTELPEGSYQAEMPGQVTRLLVKAGDHVKKGQPLLVFVSMKMENQMHALEEGIVKEIYVEEGANIEAGTCLIQIEPLKQEQTEGKAKES